jgi:flagellar biosynthesis protein FlhF
MRIKKFTAKTMREAYEMVKNDLGHDAVVLKTSKVPKGIFGGSEEIEITAAIDDEAMGANKPPEFEPLRLPGGKGGGAGGLGLYGRTRVGQSALAVDAVQPEMPEPLPPPQPNVRPFFTPPRPAPPRPLTPGQIEDLKADVQELKDLVKTVLTSATPAVISAKDEPGVTTAGDSGWDAFVKRLTDSEVKPEIARKLVDSIRGGLQITDAELEEKLIAALSEQFPVSGPLKLRKGGPLVVAFVGPTGAGKTTTLAKLASYCCPIKGKQRRVSIITTDTYKLAAMEQIRMFAEIMNIDLRLVFQAADVPPELEACADSDVVLVDSAGRSQRDKEHMEELRQMMDVLRPDETHLVLSATTKESDLHDMVHRYRNIRVNRLLFTKLDETTRLGNIFNVVSDLGIPVSYFGVGQEVPDDLEVAQAGKFVKRLMEGRAM